MDAQSKRRRLPALLKRATMRLSSKTDLALSDDLISNQKPGEITHGYTQDGEGSSLGKFGRGIRRWRVKRTKSRSESQRMPHASFPQKLTLSEGSTSVDDVPSQTSQVETPLQDVTLLQTTIQKDCKTPVPIVQEVRPRLESSESTIPQEDTLMEIGPQEAAPMDLSPCEAAPYATSHGQDAPQEISLVENEYVREPVITIPTPLPTGYSSLVWTEVTPQDEVAEDRAIVFKQDRRHARAFAKSILDDKWVFWTDASYRPINPHEGTCHHHGGIAVAHLLKTNQWMVQSAHVTGLTSVDHLETLAILLALQWAIQDREAELKLIQDGTDERPVFRVCSDSMAALQWLKKAISLGIAVRKAAQKIRATADDTDNLGGLLTLSTELNKCDSFRFSDYSCPERTFTSSIGRRTLEEYYKLCKLGTVEFHWVPAHRGLLGNEIADKEAGNACLWYANSAPRMGLGVGLVMPLRVREFRGGWKRGPQPTDVMALQTLEGAQDRWVVLTTESAGDTFCENGTAASEPASVTSGTVSHEKVTYEINCEATSAAVKKRTKQTRFLQSDTALKARSTPETGPSVSFSGQQSSPCVPGHTVEQKNAGRPRRGCRHCGRRTHTPQECFERFPEMKQALPKQYRRWAAGSRQEQVIPEAFALVRRLHPQLRGTCCPGGISRYMLGRVGLGHDMTASLTYRPRESLERQGDMDLPTPTALQHRQSNLARYGWPPVRWTAEIV